MWVFGETEMTYLAALPEPDARSRLASLFTFDVPAVFVTKGQQVAQYLLDEAASAGVPVLRCSVSTKEFYRRIKPFLELTMAPTTTLHGSLADVYGVGLLFVGDSGVGKSECVLDLVERGHRLVADDLVLASKQGNDVLIGRGHELQRHHMEIRGIGMIAGIELVEEKAGKTPLGAADVASVVGRCARDGVIIGKTTNTTPGHGNVLILAPPLVLGEDESELLATTVERAIREELPTSS